MIYKNYINNNKAKTYIFYNVQVIIIKRTMLSTRSKITNEVYSQMAYNTTNSKSMAVFQAWKFKTQRAKIYSNDNGGNHTHAAKTLCNTDNCDGKICPRICGPIFKFKIKGNNTHGQPTGKPVIELAKNDCNGNAKPQNWCKATFEKEITSEELKNLTESDMSMDKKATNFFNSKQEIIDKIDN